MKDEWSQLWKQLVKGIDEINRAKPVSPSSPFLFSLEWEEKRREERGLKADGAWGEGWLGFFAFLLLWVRGCTAANAPQQKRQASQEAKSACLLSSSFLQLTKKRSELTRKEQKKWLIKLIGLFSFCLWVMGCSAANAPQRKREQQHQSTFFCFFKERLMNSLLFFSFLCRSEGPQQAKKERRKQMSRWGIAGAEKSAAGASTNHSQFNFSSLLMALNQKRK